MRFIYSLLYSCAFVLALPYFLIVGLFRGKYLQSVWQRLGFDLPVSDRPSMWLHSVSVGEFLAAKPLIQKMRVQFPEIPLFVSTTTKTGQALASDLLPGFVFYFPFDWAWCVRRVLNSLQPGLILVLETEIWPNFLWEAKSRKIPVILVNGRISDRSFSRYRMVRQWLPIFDENMMQTEQDASRIKTLGASPESVSIMGNLKFDLSVPSLQPSLRKLLTDWKKSHLLWIVGSSMKGEEQILIQVFQNLKRKNPLRMMIAPRHPERFDEVVDLVKQNNLSVARRSSDSSGDASVMVLDSIGELAACYELADVVFLGGTLGAYGGHNPIEPAYFGKAIVAGRHYKNFNAVFEKLRQRRAILITDDIENDLAKLIHNEALREQMGSAARQLVQENSGAINIVLQKVRDMLHAGSDMGPVSKLPV
jgi:3-deoxy-D-manno-octulosonic-acid transferase